MRVKELENIDQILEFIGKTGILPTRIIRGFLKHKDGRLHVFYLFEFKTLEGTVVFFTDEPTNHSGSGRSFMVNIERFIMNIQKYHREVVKVENYQCDFDFYWLLRNLFYNKYVESEQNQTLF